uniref:Reverse transcriptase domain-containing protein n=1 Tax=Tanacetum cinerariifolium TaxID=118510 RepID=A0A699JSM9_TANCI|nr:reverse transcriptase domain-containing protein [Tanacetum cinerariifolium]
MIRVRDDIPKENIPPQRRFVLTTPPPRCDVAESSATIAARPPKGQYNFVDIVEARQGLIRSLSHDARTIARAADRAKDLHDARNDRRDIRLEIDVVRGQRTAYEIELHEGTEGIVGLSQWLKNMESVFHISGYAVDNQVKFATCTLLEKVDKYISGLPDTIHGNVISTRPKSLDDAIELANDLMDQKLCTYAERQNNNKRKADDSLRNNQQQ